jgi:hypothetical protein
MAGWAGFAKAGFAVPDPAMVRRGRGCGHNVVLSRWRRHFKLAAAPFPSRKVPVCISRREAKYYAQFSEKRPRNCATAVAILAALSSPYG